MKLNDKAEVWEGDCVTLMRERLEPQSVQLVFADPPFNIGLRYDLYSDNLSDDEYLEWTEGWMREVWRVLCPGGTFWFTSGDRYAAEMKVVAQRKVGFHTRSWVIWYYSFGPAAPRNFARCHTHLFYMVKDPENFVFNGDAIRVPSMRQLKYNDRRANPKGKLPDNVWILNPKDPRAGFTPTQDVWPISRVAGSFRERTDITPCQIPEALMERVILSTSREGDVVLDPFLGSGTTGAVAKRLGRYSIGIELSPQYARGARERIGQVGWRYSLDEPTASQTS